MGFSVLFFELRMSKSKCVNFPLFTTQDFLYFLKFF